MNRIAIVGHPSSRYEDVLALLQESGMTPVRPSRREGLSPQDINATLMKAHDAPLVSAVLDEDGFAPLDTGPVWHGMALDLMLGNLDEPLCGWADPHAIYALDYWKGLDPQLTFVLVYDEPHRVLTDAAAQGESLSAEGVDRLLDNWTAYNGALLRFYLRHSSRSVLVHAQQARRAASTYLQRLQELLDTPLSLPDLDSDREGAVRASPALGASTRPAVLDEVMSVAGTAPQEAAAILTADVAERYLVDGVLTNHRRALQRRAELQSAASLPLDREADGSGDAAIAWETLVTQRNFMIDLLAQLHAKYRSATKELGEARNRLEDARSAQARENERLSSELRQLEQARDAEKAKANQQRKEREKASVEYDKKLQDLGADNELLLTQLHHVQEELEQNFLRKQQLEQRLDDARQRLKNASQRLKEADQRFGRVEHEAELVRQQLSYRLGQVLLRHGRTPWGWLVLPFALLREVRAYRKQGHGA